MPSHIQLGQRGEQIATDYLLSLGYRVLARNVRLGRDEIDVIAEDAIDTVLVFVEVKTRLRASVAFAPHLNLTHRKRLCLCRAARAWVALHHYEGGYRIDAVCIAGGRVVDHYRELPWIESA